MPAALLSNPTNRTKKLFSDFYFYAVVFGFTREEQAVWPQVSQSGILNELAKILQHLLHKILYIP